MNMFAITLYNKLSQLIYCYPQSTLYCENVSTVMSIHVELGDSLTNTYYNQSFLSSTDVGPCHLSPWQWQDNGTADLAGWNISLCLSECRWQTRLSVWPESEWRSFTNTSFQKVPRLVLHEILCVCGCTHFMCSCLCEESSFCVVIPVCRSVWRCCAATVNRTLRGGISVTAPFMTWPLMTAKICSKTSVSSFMCVFVFCALKVTLRGCILSLWPLVWLGTV